MAKIQVAVLGATGNIGQRFIQLLEDHPYFEIQGLYASERSEGKKLKQVLRIKDYPFKEETLERKIEQLDVKNIASRVPGRLLRPAHGHSQGLRAGPGRQGGGGLLQRRLAPDEGRRAVADPGSERGAHQAGQDPEIVQERRLHRHQRQLFHHRTGHPADGHPRGVRAALPVRFHLPGGVSGAGYPGVPSLDILGNVVPYIKSEEEKMEAEIFKMLGTISPKGGVKDAVFEMVASCARVPVIDGHMESAAMIMGKSPTVEEMATRLNEYRAEPQRLELPTAPRQPIIVRSEDDRPQPIRCQRRRTGQGEGHGGHRRSGAAERTSTPRCGCSPTTPSAAGPAARCSTRNWPRQRNLL